MVVGQRRMWWVHRLPIVWGIVLALFAIHAFVVSGSMVEAGGPKVTIRGLLNEAFAAPWQDRLVAEFNQHYPEIEVIIDSAPYDELLSKQLLELTRFPVAYDFLITDEPWLPQLADTGLLAPLQQTFKEITSPDYDWDDFHPAALAAGEWQGVVYGVPVRSNLLLLMYNRALFRAAGVEEPTPGMTWDEFEEKAAALVKDTTGDGKPDQWGFATYFGREPLTPTIWQAILNSNGGQIVDDNFRPVFNNSLGVEALEAHKRFATYGPPGAETYTFGETLEAFRQGKVGMIFNWGSAYRGIAIDPETTTLAPGDAGIMVMPAGTEGPSSHRGIWVAVIPEHSEQKEAAWQFIQWVTSREGEAWSAQHIGTLPARRSTLQADPPEDWLGPVYEAILDGYDAIERGKMWRPRTPHADIIRRALEINHSRFMTGSVSAEQALQDAAEEIEREFGYLGYYK